MDHDYQSYIRDLVHLVREAAENAREDCRDDGAKEGFEGGRALAYAEVLSLMQSQADAFLIPKELLGLGGFNPAEDLAVASRSSE